MKTKRAKRNNLTYSGNKTKYQKERSARLSFIFGILSLVFLLSTYSAAADYIMINRSKEIKTITNISNNIDIKDLTIITLTSSNPTNEQIAYLAAFQACDKLLPNTKECPLLLVSIAHRENRDFNYKSTGADSYTSYGLFQISLHFNPSVTKEQALDPYFSANWTLRRLIANGYPKQVANPVRAHNGSITNPKTLTYLNGVLDYYNSIK